MKVRMGFVSNSSSSSFIIGTDADYTSPKEIIMELIKSNPDGVADAIITGMTTCPVDNGSFKLLDKEEDINKQKKRNEELKDCKHLWAIYSPFDCCELTEAILQCCNKDNMVVAYNS
jgi:hypothetical protein